MGSWNLRFIYFLGLAPVISQLSRKNPMQWIGVMFVAGTGEIHNFFLKLSSIL
jgi:hypothetical protein